MKRGFTLVEMIVALTLFSLLVGGLFYSLSGGLRNWRKISRRAALGQIRLIVAERLCADLRQGVVLPGSTSSEAIVRLDGDQVSYQLSAGKVKRNSAYLTVEGEIGRLEFAYHGRLTEVRLDGLSFEVQARNE